MVVRIGRVLWWISLLFAVIVCIANITENHIVVGLIAGVVIAAIGRGVRYILANE